MSENAVPSPEQCVEVLRSLNQHPSVAFHEHRVAREIARRVRGHGLALTVDAFGNLLAAHTPRRVPSGAGPLALVAHMDHPGFEVVGQPDPSHLLARSLGGVAPTYFQADQGAPVRVFPWGNDGASNTGEGLAARSVGERTAGAAPGGWSARTVVLELEKPATVPLPAICVPDVPVFAEEGDVLRLRAADDLAGCAAALLTLEAVAAEGIGYPVLALFTRAEEGGLYGARLAAEHGTLPQDAVVVSLEASRELPGAVIGGGPVIRVGDASATFAMAAEEVLLRARARLRAREPEFPVQRQLLSGGTCEATAFVARGYAATGIAVPLGNYHNNIAATGPSGERFVAGSRGGVGAEAIHRGDLHGEVRLLVEAAVAMAEGDVRLLSERFGAVDEETARRLRAGKDGLVV